MGHEEHAGTVSENAEVQNNLKLRSEQMSIENEIEEIQRQKQKLDMCIEHLETLKSLIPETDIEINKEFYRKEIRQLTDQELALRRQLELFIIE